MTATTDTSVDPAIKAASDQANLVKLQAEARKASADASTAEVAARSGALKAAIGEIAGSGIAGSVTASETAGIAESNALVSGALGTVAAAIAAKLAATPHRRFLLVLGTAPPSVTAAGAFELQLQLVAKSLTDALAATEPDADRDEAPSSRAAGQRSLTGDLLTSSLFTAPGLVLSGLNAVLSYARTDVTLGGREVKPHDRALLSGVAGALVAADKEVRLDGPSGAVRHATISHLVRRIEPLASSAATVRQRAAGFAAKIADATKSTATTAEDKPGAHRPDPELPLYQRALATLDAALATFDGFYASLLHDDGTGPLVLRIAEALEVDELVRTSAVVLLAFDGAWSSTLSKKNILSSLFGCVPFEVNAYVTASWQLLDGATGAVLGAGTEATLLPYCNLLKIT